MKNEKKMDVRVKKTYKKLVDGMVELLSNKMLDEISVLEICEVSNVHRATFYKHFEDKYAFLKFFFEMLLQELSFDELLADVEKASARKVYSRVISDVIGFAQEHRRLIENVTDLNQSQLFVSLFTDELAKTLENVIEKRVSQTNNDEVSAPLLAAFYAGAMVGMLRWWVINGTQYSSEEIELFANKRMDELMLLYGKKENEQ